MQDGEVSATRSSQLTPRQDRLESAIERVLRTRGTRSELRELVNQYADLARLQGVPAERAINGLEALALRTSETMTAESTPAVGDSPADRLALMVRWCTARYYRAD